APGRRLRRCVVIHTERVDRRRGQAEGGVGGGVVCDPTPGDELEETANKARVLTARRPLFRLLETMRWQPEGGYYLLVHHLQRLQHSAGYFGFAIDPGAIAAGLERRAATCGDGVQGGRLLLDRSGAVTLDVAPYVANATPRKVCLAPQPIDRDDPFLYHKTTHRTLYERALAACPGYDDVLLWN